MWDCIFYGGFTLQRLLIRSWHCEGDRPMTTGGYGPPLDELDAVCKSYKDCVQCANKKYGEKCFGEIIKYKYAKSDSDVACGNPLNTCERALCECDAHFAREHVKSHEVFNEDWHLFWSTLPGGFEPKDYCPTAGTGGSI